jgi:glutamyl-tRNA synthetase
MTDTPASPYRGRLAPSPTGFLHLGHAQTFWIAAQRVKSANGTLILRIEDLDRDRARPEFVTALIDDLQWLGIDWSDGPRFQSERVNLYQKAFNDLATSGSIYPCYCSRKDVQTAVQAPHGADDETIYPGTCREKRHAEDAKANVSWRFSVPDGEEISFVDGFCGRQRFVAGRDFGDFVVWSRRNGRETPAYQLAVVTDDAEMGITEVVRGVDLLVSTARQLLLYRALGLRPPVFCHCPLVKNSEGIRLAKRDAALCIRALREQGFTPKDVLANFRLPSPPGPLSAPPSIPSP